MSREELLQMAGHTEEDNSRNQRIAAMRELAGSEQATASANGPTPNRAPRKRRSPATFTALLAIVVLVSAGATWKGLFPWQQHARPTSNVTSINLASDSLFCPSYAAWSPDGQQVAVLAKVGACGNADAGILTQDAVAIVDIHGHLVRQIYVDGSIPGYKTNGSSTSLVYPRFWGLAWSLDGKQVALPFWMVAGPENTSSLSESGVVVTPVDGTTTTAIISAAFYGYDYWDIQARQAIHNNTNWPFSLSYQWSANGELVATAVPPATAPVGNPSGGLSFTIWQPGTVMLDRKQSTLTLSGNLTIMSPDGHYLIPELGFSGELDPAAKGFALGPDGEYHLAPRDKGLIAAAGRLKDLADPYITQTSVAWRADGKVIAATDPNALIDQVLSNGNLTDIPAASQSVTIFDCVSGAKLLTLKTHSLANRLSHYSGVTPQPALGWNAQGSRLFFLDTNFDTLSVWNVNLR